MSLHSFRDVNVGMFKPVFLNKAVQIRTFKRGRFHWYIPVRICTTSCNNPMNAINIKLIAFLVSVNRYLVSVMPNTIEANNNKDITERITNSTANISHDCHIHFLLVSKNFTYRKSHMSSSSLLYSL